jgi:hypothetical protein
MMDAKNRSNGCIQDELTKALQVYKLARKGKPTTSGERIV